MQFCTDFQQIFGSGGSVTVDGSAKKVDHNITTSWQKFEVTLTTGSLSGKTIGTNGNDSLDLILNLPQASTYIFDLAQVQVEKGVVATDFEIRPIGEELILCERYFERMGGEDANHPLATGAASSTTTARGVIPYRVKKRADPTITFSAQNLFRFSNATANLISTAVVATPLNTQAFAIRLTIVGAVANSGGIIDTSSSAGTIDIDSEL